MSFLEGEFSIKCDNCKEQINFQPNDADFEASGGSERQMGSENSYAWEYEFKCFDCKKQNIKINYEVWEYPVGALNYEKVEIEGATEISRFGYDFHAED